MKIAVPIANGLLCQHFGHCERFAIVNVDPDAKLILSTAELIPPVHAPGVLPAWLAEQQVKLVIAGGMGQRAQQLLNQAGIEVLVGAPGGEPAALAAAYLDGSLVCGQNVCDH